MSVVVKLGRRPAVVDARVPFLADVSTVLPLAPPEQNWYAGPEEGAGWGMLGNDTVGDCVQAAAFHLLKSATSYADKPLIPTEAEALQAYSESTGYTAGDPNTDQGTVVLGPGGFIEYWVKTGLPIGGARNKVSGFVQVKPAHWQVAIHLFGGAMFGINLPENVVASDTVPYDWRDAGGQVAGGHEVYVAGYFVESGVTYYPLVSWGVRYLATAAFLSAVTEEVVCVVDPAAMNARGVNADGIDLAALDSAMAALLAAR
jgi:hypothetical protein